MLLSLKQLIGLPVYTKSGELLGDLDELEIDTDGQMVTNYLVGNKNVIKNLWSDKLTVHRSQILDITEEKIIVDDLVAEKKELLVKSEVNEEIPEGVTASVINDNK